MLGWSLKAYANAFKEILLTGNNVDGVAYETTVSNPRILTNW